MIRRSQQGRKSTDRVYVSAYSIPILILPLCTTDYKAKNCNPQTALQYQTEVWQ